MKKLFLLVISLLAIAALAQDAPKAPPSSVAGVLNQQLKYPESELVSLAEAIPEDKYSFAPSNGEFKGVRTISDQIKHIATVNYMIGSAISGEKPPMELKGENGPVEIKSKADIAKFLNDSFAFLHKAFDSITPANQIEPINSPFGDGKTTRLGMATIGVAHIFDHYGQLAVYSRMNSIIPPASRPQPEKK